MRFKTGFWLLVVIVVLVGVFGVRAGWFGLPDLSGFKRVAVVTEKLEVSEEIPPDEQDWCVIQNFQVKESLEEPVTRAVIGWDWKTDSCVYEVTGYNCALGRNVTYDYGVTALVGGDVPFLIIDGFDVPVDVDTFWMFMQDVDKQDLGKTCDSSIYPEVVVDG